MFYVLLKLFRLPVSGDWSFSLSWAAIRMLAGVVFGLPLLYMYGGLQQLGISETASYIASFGGLRLVEWGILFALVARQHNLAWRGKAMAWVGGGAIASMLSDGLALVSGANELKFFC